MRIRQRGSINLHGELSTVLNQEFKSPPCLRKERGDKGGAPDWSLLASQREAVDGAVLPACAVGRQMGEEDVEGAAEDVRVVA